MPDLPDPSDPRSSDRLPKKRTGLVFPLLVLIFIVIVVMMSQMGANDSRETSITYGKLVRILKGEDTTHTVSKAIKKSGELEVYMEDKKGKKIMAVISVDEREEALNELLIAKLGANYNKEKPSAIWPVLLSLAPWVILIFLF